MGTRVAQNVQDQSGDMPGKFSLKSHVKKLTKECLKAFDSSTPEKPDSFNTTGLALDSTDDGVDSGVEVVRALSSNGSDRYTPGQSCGSSLVSCCSEPEADRGSDCGSENSGKANGNPSSGTKAGARSRVSSRRRSDKDTTSESCSENSSTCESHRTVSNRPAGRRSECGKTTATRREESNTRLSSRDRSSARSQSTARANGEKPALKPRPTTRPSDPRKLDDGRWPSAVQKNQTSEVHRPRNLHLKVSNATVSSSMTSSMTSSSSSFNGKSPVGEMKSSALDKYGTLPRRPKRKSLENGGDSIMNQSLSLVRSSSVSREPSLNRAATLRRQQSREKEQGNHLGNGKSLPPYPKTRKATGKTVIYHEISVQTSVTGQDIGNLMSGAVPVLTPTVEKANKAVQSEGREKLKEIEESFAKQNEELQTQRRENDELKQERQMMITRICKLLGYATPKSPDGKGESEMSELEHHFKAVGLTVIKQQEELSELKHFKSIMQRDLEKSFAAQKNLLQQQQDIEAEYFELQEFLQAEKTALSESLTDTEAELEKLRREVTRKEELLQRQEEECKHLVRICEQRRQENLSLEAKLSGLEQRSRDVIVQQGAAVSGAAVALSGLGARLDSLVEQLATSCNISEKDLEDVIYHNEVYAQGQSSEDNSPDVPVAKKVIGDAPDSPKRSTSFLNAIMGALRSATQSPFASAKKNSSSNENSSDSLGLLEATDNCLAIEEAASSVSHYTDCVSCSSRGELLKYDICTDDAITLVANVETYEGSSSPDLSRSDSIQNLSAAILARQEIEKIERNLSPDLIIPTEVNSLVDKVIDVDNLLTKLLKVLRIIQLENDVSLEQLEDQRLDLTEKLQQEELCRQKTEDKLQKLQYELKDARSQLSARIIQLEQAKMMLSKDACLVIADSQRQFAAIHNAIGTLHSIQDVVNKCPPLAKLQQDLEDCNYRAATNAKNSSGCDDLNANTTNLNNKATSMKEVKQRNGPVLTTAV